MRRSGQRGFSLLLVMVLVSVMCAVAAGRTWALRVRPSRSPSPKERQAGAALYAAQAAVALAKDALLGDGGDAAGKSEANAHPCGSERAQPYFVTVDGDAVSWSWCARVTDAGTVVEAYGFAGATTSHLSWALPRDVTARARLP